MKKAGRVKRVAVAMSGGVDSSVAAAILKQEGFEITGFTFLFDPLGSKAVKNARGVADALGIGHQVINLTDVLKDKVIDNFCQEYFAGKTPNPCVRCNRYVKFGALLKQIMVRGYDFLATGHYVKKLKTKKGFLLKKGKDRYKDQSYFLYCLRQRQLKRLLFPLGSLNKAKVVELAKQKNLPVIQGRESQEICFLKDVDYRNFLKEHTTIKIKSGYIVDKTGKILGMHKGIAFYTIGQREGLGVALGEPFYVIKIDTENNKIILGKLRDAYGRDFIVKQPNFISHPIKKKVVYKVKIRYNHKEAEAEIHPEGKNLKVSFSQPQFAITPGQSAVFYKGDFVIGGGIISLNEKA